MTDLVIVLTLCLATNLTSCHQERPVPEEGPPVTPIGCLKRGQEIGADIAGAGYVLAGVRCERRRPREMGI